MRPTKSSMDFPVTANTFSPGNLPNCFNTNATTAIIKAISTKINRNILINHVLILPIIISSSFIDKTFASTVNLIKSLRHIVSYEFLILMEKIIHVEVYFYLEEF